MTLSKLLKEQAVQAVPHGFRSSFRDVAHPDSRYDEWGFSGSVRFDPGMAGRGLWLNVTPSFGAAAQGADRLWAMQDLGGLAPYGACRSTWAGSSRPTSATGWWDRTAAAPRRRTGRRRAPDPAERFPISVDRAGNAERGPPFPPS